ncbi:LuxR C-terminal-related transcriptional regulator [Spirillospora sp. NPDC047279]|uniref:helix-turn-helix transcriptional regulator n=1 Tax=Spirillospora sp. NPDC047279 TaxID=3155478 RepID=UPI00340AADCA
MARSHEGPAVRADRWPLTGREAELGMIRSTLGARGPGGVLFAAPAGAGRTRLVREAQAMAGRAGWDAQWLSVTRSTSAVPFGAMSGLLPVNGRTGGGTSDGLRRMVRAAARRAAGRPLVLCVDDAHLLDEQSASAVHLLVAHGLVALVATVRPDEPAPDAVDALWRDGLVRRADLDPLGATEMEALVDAALGPQVETVTRRELLRLAAGNPWTLRELLAGAAADGSLAHRQGQWSWSPSGRRYGAGLRAPAEAAFAALPEPERAVLEVVSCAGPLPWAVLGRLAQAGFLDGGAVTAAGARGLIVQETAERRRTARPGHPLDAEILRTTLPAARVLRIREVVAEALADLPGRRRGDVADRASRALDAGAAPPAATLLDAARRASAGPDLMLTERLAGAAHQAGADTSGVHGGWIRSLASLVVTGHVDQARRLADEEYEHAAERLDRGAAAGWAACRGVLAKAQGDLAAARSTLVEAAVLADGTPWAGFLLAELAATAALTGDAEAAAGRMRQAARCPEPPPLAGPWIALDRAWTVAAAGDLDEAAGRARRAAEAARALGQPAVEILAWYDLARMDRPHEALAPLTVLADTLTTPLSAAMARACAALAAADGPALDDAAAAFTGFGLSVHAAEAAAAAVRAHRDLGTRHRPAMYASRARLTAILASCAITPRTPLLKRDDDLAALTPRERQIALLVATGLRSKSVASRLSLSVRTVDNHLGRAYAKLGVSGRAELAATIGGRPARPK